MDRVVAVDTQTERLELLFIGDGGGLSCKTCQHNASDQKAVGCKGVYKAEKIHVIGDSQVTADLVFFNVCRVNDDHDLHLIPQCFQHCDLGVRRKTRQHSGGMVIIEKLAAEFQIELSAELGDALFYVTGLCL